MKFAAFFVWILAIVLIVGTGIVRAYDPAIDTWHGEGLERCPVGRVCS